MVEAVSLLPIHYLHACIRGNHKCIQTTSKRFFPCSLHSPLLRKWRLPEVLEFFSATPMFCGALDLRRGRAMPVKKMNVLYFYGFLIMYKRKTIYLLGEKDSYPPSWVPLRKRAKGTLMFGSFFFHNNMHCVTTRITKNGKNIACHTATVF